jgi:hypothetical protein
MMSWSWILGFVFLAVVIDLLALPSISRYLHNRQSKPSQPSNHTDMWIRGYDNLHRSWSRITTSTKRIILIWFTWIRQHFLRLATEIKAILSKSKNKPLVLEHLWHSTLVEEKPVEIVVQPIVAVTKIGRNRPEVIHTTDEVYKANNEPIKSDQQGSHVDITVNLTNGQKVMITIESKQGSSLNKTH